MCTVAGLSHPPGENSETHWGSKPMTATQSDDAHDRIRAAGYGES